MFPHDIGGSVEVHVGTKPTDSAAGTIKGTGFDRTHALSCVLALACGVATGSPSPQTADCKLQHSDTDVDGDYVDYEPDGVDTGVAAVTQATADNAHPHRNVNLGGAKKFIRSVVTVALTGGSTPKWPVASTIILGGINQAPSSY